MFSLHRIDKEAGWEALRCHHPDVTRVYAFFRCDLMPKGPQSEQGNDLAGKRANVVLHAITMASHDVGTDKFRFGESGECEETLVY